jgi:hypothetical protein
VAPAAVVLRRAQRGSSRPGEAPRGAAELRWVWHPSPGGRRRVAPAGAGRAEARTRCTDVGSMKMVTKDRLVVGDFFFCELLVIFTGNLICDVN